MSTGFKRKILKKAYSAALVALLPCLSLGVTVHAEDEGSVIESQTGKLPVDEEEEAGIKDGDREQQSSYEDEEDRTGGGRSFSAAGEEEAAPGSGEDTEGDDMTDLPAGAELTDEIVYPQQTIQAMREQENELPQAASFSVILPDNFVPDTVPGRYICKGYPLDSAAITITNTVLESEKKLTNAEKRAASETGDDNRDKDGKKSGSAGEDRGEKKDAEETASGKDEAEDKADDEPAGEDKWIPSFAEPLEEAGDKNPEKTEDNAPGDTVTEEADESSAAAEEEAAETSHPTVRNYTALTAEVFEKAANEGLDGELQLKVDTFASTSTVRASDQQSFPGFRISAEISGGSKPIVQETYIVLSSDRVFSVTYARASDDDYGEIFRKSAATIAVY